MNPKPKLAENWYVAEIANEQKYFKTNLSINIVGRHKNINTFTPKSH